MKKSLDSIAEFYVHRGYTGQRLRQALEKDKEYQGLVRERQKRISKETKVSKKEKARYVLAIDEDFEILKKCKSLLKKGLNKEDKELVELIKTQLEDDWRKPLVKKLNQLLKKYKIT